MNDLIDTDLSDPRHFAAGPPHEVFAALRERDPVHHNPAGFVGEEFWSLTRWEDIAAASKDTATFSSTDGSTIPGNAAMGDFTTLMMVNQDPPLHTQRRAIVSKVFTARAIAVQGDVVREVITGLVDRVADAGRCDLVRDVTAPFPLFVIADMLGVPREDHESFLRWSNAIGRLQGDDDAAGELATAMQEMGAYLAAFIASRRAEPRDDLISRLIHAEVDGVSLTDAELMVSFAEIMVAGNETTRNTLAGAVWLLIEHPEQLAALRADPSLADNAAEEVLRFWTPNVYQARTLTTDVVLHGRELRKGERIAMWLCSANRDPAVHSDADRFDIRRADPRHMSFGGGGRHFCLGAGLARLELSIGLQVLPARLDELALDRAPAVIPHTFFHALDTMPLTFRSRHEPADRVRADDREGGPHLHGRADLAAASDHAARGPAGSRLGHAGMALARTVRRHPGAEVTSFRFGRRDDGATARCALTVSYNGPGQEAGLPTRLFTKSTPTFTTRMLSAAVNLNEVEAAFYTHLRPELDIEAPQGYHAAYDPLTERGFLLLEDVAASRGATFGDVLSRRLTREQAEDVIAVLATLHARYWNAPVLRRFGRWMRNSLEYVERLNVTLPAKKRLAVGCERGRAVIPPELYRRRDEIHPALMRAMTLNVSGPQTLLHTDVHPGNWYVTRDGRMGLYDWACLTSGGWARDVAYALATHLPPEDRRDWERDLVVLHGELLTKQGITPPPPDEAFRLYSQQMTHPMLMWIGTLGLSRLMGVTHKPEVTLESVRRATIAAHDLGTLDLV